MTTNQFESKSTLNELEWPIILALQVLTIKTNIQNIRKHKTIDESDVSELGTFANFSAYMSESYIRDGLIPDETAFRVNSFVEGFHDALIMYALSIDFVSFTLISYPILNPFFRLFLVKSIGMMGDRFRTWWGAEKWTESDLKF